jgi:competence protein ComEC
VGAIFLPLGQVLGLSLGGMLFILNQLVALLSHLPYAAIVCAKISPVNIVIYYFSLWYFLLPKERRAALLGNSFKEYQLILALGIIAAFIQFYPAMASVVDPKGLTIELLDVGQGDSILVRSNDHAFLVDGGDRYMGGRLLSYLVKRKIKKLDFVVLTHPHDDHVGGLLKTLENFQVDQVFDDGEGAEYGENSPVSESYRRFLELIRQNNIKYSRLFAGTNLIWQDKVKIEVVNPPNFSCKPPDKNLNNNSIAFRLLYGNFSMLFTGDMEEPAEKAVLCSNYPLDSLVLKVGHHGSRTATSSKFLGLINPQFAAISAGHSNRFHHPHAATLRKLELAGAKVLRTDQLGTIQIFTDGRAWKIDHLQ